mgnify:CR=1 FL=1
MPTGRSAAASLGVLWPVVRIARRITFMVSPEGTVEEVIQHERQVWKHLDEVIAALERAAPSLEPERAPWRTGGFPAQGPSGTLQNCSASGRFRATSTQRSTDAPVFSSRRRACRRRTWCPWGCRSRPASVSGEPLLDAARLLGGDPDLACTAREAWWRRPKAWPPGRRGRLAARWPCRCGSSPDREQPSRSTSGSNGAGRMWHTPAGQRDAGSRGRHRDGRAGLSGGGGARRGRCPPAHAGRQGTWSRRPASTTPAALPDGGCGAPPVVTVCRQSAHRRACPELRIGNLGAPGCRPRTPARSPARHALGIDGTDSVAAKFFPQRRGGPGGVPLVSGGVVQWEGPGDADRSRRGVPPLSLRRGAGGGRGPHLCRGGGHGPRSRARWERSRRRAGAG